MTDPSDGGRGGDAGLSRSHVLAGVAAAFLLVSTGFAAGLAVGNREMPTVVDPPSLLGDVADDRLVDLLARVEAAGRSDGGLADLSYPSALVSDVVSAVVDAPPPGSHTIEVRRFEDPAEASALRERLREEGVSAWVGLDLVSGTPWYAVRVGGYPDEEAAKEAAADSRVAALGPVVVRELAP